jgi:hypothetical protein
MKQLVPAALISALIGGGVAYWVSNTNRPSVQSEDRQLELVTGALQDLLATNEKVGYILINKAAEAGKCKATATPHITAYGGQHLKWNFNVVDESCLDNGARVQIRFKTTSPTEDPQPISTAGKRHIKAKLKDIFVENTTVEYGIWMVPAKGDPYLMEDPELEIISTMRLKNFILENPLPPLLNEPAVSPSSGTNPPGNQSPAAPQKKQ